MMQVIILWQIAFDLCIFAKKITIMSFFLIRTTLPTVLIILFLFLILEPTHKTKITTWQPKKVAKKDSIIFLTITNTGDLMCHGSQFQLAKQADGSYDFLPVYSIVREYLEASDFTMGNLETVLAGKTKNFSGYPQFNSPNEYADALKKVGFDALITTNNHSYDYLDAGILRTLEQLKDRNISAIGTFYSAADRDSIRIFDIKGVKVALLAYTEFSNNPVAASKRFSINFIDSTLLAKDIKKARVKGAEIVIINFHWGIEYKHFPSDYQKNITRYAAKLGADIIFGGHPHVLQPVEFLPSRDSVGLDSCFVIYSMGNFISAQSKRYTDAGLMLTLNLTKNLTTNKIHIQNVDYVPTWVFKGITNGKSQYLIFPAFAVEKDLAPEEIKFLTAVHLQKMKQAGEDSKEILTHFVKKLRNVAWKKRIQADSISYVPLKINILADSVFAKKVIKK